MYVGLIFYGLLTLANAHCPLGYTLTNNSLDVFPCYISIDQPTDWKTASTNCMKVPGGFLAYVYEEKTNVFLQAIVNDSLTDSKTNRWLNSMSIKTPEGDTEWLWEPMQVPITYSNWANGEPQQVGYCMVMSPDTGKWDASQCTAKLPYYCVAPQLPDTPADPQMACDSTWAWFNETNLCYKVFHLQNFSAAESTCVSNGGHLASVHSTSENIFIRELAMTGYNSADNPKFAAWIGAQSSIIDTSTFAWTDGTPFDYENWETTYPKTTGQNMCVAMYTDNDGYNEKWFNYGCSTVERAFVCKKASLLNY